jgi:hypothetical protein
MKKLYILMIVLPILCAIVYALWVHVTPVQFFDVLKETYVIAGFICIGTLAGHKEWNECLWAMVSVGMLFVFITLIQVILLPHILIF